MVPININKPNNNKGGKRPLKRFNRFKKNIAAIVHENYDINAV
jgi:hypothetical protein